jgi:hypothetical protein
MATLGFAICSTRATMGFGSKSGVEMEKSVDGIQHLVQGEANINTLEYFGAWWIK